MYTIYIDWANLHQWSKDWWNLDYEKLRKWLIDKYKAKEVFLFMWYIKGNEQLYSYLSNCGYKITFKETLQVDGKTKWNCDAELVLQAISDFYENNTNKVIIITGDWDFSCLVEFYKIKSCDIIILAPNKKYCSYLLKKKNIPIVYLEEMKHKFTKNAH